jgi:hypothetical protein
VQAVGFLTLFQLVVISGQPLAGEKEGLWSKLASMKGARETKIFIAVHLPLTFWRH